VRNRPSDGRERYVTTALAVVPRPGATLTVPPPPPPAPKPAAPAAAPPAAPAPVVAAPAATAPPTTLPPLEIASPPAEPNMDLAMDDDRAVPFTVAVLAVTWHAAAAVGVLVAGIRHLAGGAGGTLTRTARAGGPCRPARRAAPGRGSPRVARVRATTA
jgi:hypothetical protein